MRRKRAETGPRAPHLAGEVPAPETAPFPASEPLFPPPPDGMKPASRPETQGDERAGMAERRDTIAAVATPPGRGGIGVVRLSGPHAAGIAARVVGRLPPPHEARLRTFRDAGGASVDRGLVLFKPEPASYTGEDTVELHGHGGAVVSAMVLDCVLGAGARLARPGEFSERAFLNGRMDLSQAEAVADLIESASEQAARSAMRSLEGAFAARIRALVEELIGVRTYVEAAIDFPEEEIDFLAEPDLAQRLRALCRALSATLEEANQGRTLRDGLGVVIAGPPNVGKSTLLNRLSGRDAAIVTDIPGTTRDALHETLHLDGLPLRLTDTAGLRAGADPVERMGVERARAAIAGADLILYLVDDRSPAASDETMPEISPAQTLVRVHNKIDLSGAPPGLDERVDPPVLRISARTGEGIAALRGRLKAVAGYRSGEDGVFIARRRHVEALEEAAEALERGAVQLAGRGAGELLAEDLRAAQDALGRISGVVRSDDLLARIFSSFCIGK